MSFVFASSHLPEVKRPDDDDEEEEDEVQPMQRSGMVRAFSHLPQRVQGAPAAPRPSASSPALLPSWLSEPTETEHEPEAETDAGSHGDFEPPAAAGSAPHGAIGPVSPRGAAPSAGRSLFLTPRPMPPEHAQQQSKTYGSAPDNASNSGNLGSSPQLAARADALAQAGGQQPGQGLVQPRENSETPKQTLPAASVPISATNGTQKGASAGKATPSTTIRLGDYPGFNADGYEPKEMDDWNQAFRNTYGTSAVNAARKNGVPARLLAALSANEMAAKDWTAFDALADRNTLATKSVGPLQISSKTALKYKLVPIDNEFYGASQADRWTALHDPDVRHGQSTPPSGLTPGQRLSTYQDNPYPNNPNGAKIVHDYLDNPATGFDAGAKLLKIYLQRLVDDRKSGAYLNYSKDFLDLSRLSSKEDPIHKDLDIIASGDKEAIHKLHFSYGLGKALAMLWNNGEDILGKKDMAQTPNASKHASNMLWQYDNQNAIIPATGSPQP